MAFLTHQKDGLLWQSSTLLDTPHAFTTRYGGVSQGQYDSLNLSLIHI